MGEIVQLTASDGHQLEAYRSTPAGTPRAGLVVIQEVFGLTDHIRAVTDDFAARGFLAVAPGLFDRVEPGIRFPYTEVEQGRDTMMKLDLEQSTLDLGAAVAAASSAGKVGAVGYCWGGAMADLAACKLDVAAAVAYYGRANVNWLDLKPRCPVMYHFGGRDPIIPPELVQQIRDGRPDGEFFIYPDASHGFNCNDRADYHLESAELALERSLEFFDRCL